MRRAYMYENYIYQGYTVDPKYHYPSQDGVHVVLYGYYDFYNTIVQENIHEISSQEIYKFVTTVEPTPTQLIKFRNKTIPPSGTLEEQILWFLNKARYGATYFRSNSASHCYAGANRTIQDIYIFLWYYNHDLRLADVMRAMYQLLQQKFVHQFICSTIRRRVFILGMSPHLQHHVEHTGEKDEFGYLIEEWKTVGL